MKRSLRGLSIIVTVAPLLGLLGTVYGMISAFETASSAGVGKADVLAKGIYEALVTTAAGLTIAIPVLLVFQFLNNRVDTIIDKLDEMGIDFMTHCTGKTESQGKE
jgi:biopolymer transport protein ExbB